MKKVIRKSKAKRKSYSRAERRLRSWRGRFIRAQNAGEKASLDDQAFVAMVNEAIVPYKERGELYFNLLGQIGLKVDGTDGMDLNELPATIDKAMAHLRELTTGGLNYDDMRAALNDLHRRPWWAWWIKRYILESSGASKALIGAPVSDAGAMRRALQMVDANLTAVVQSIDSEKPTPPEAWMSVWNVIHAARKAMKAVEEANPETIIPSL